MTRRFRSTFVTLLAAAGMFTAFGSAVAQQLPKSGSIEFHTGWKFTGTAVNVADKHVQGHGTVSGVTFNNKGSGPLHLGPANCFATFHLIQGQGRDQGFCTFSDPDGDRIFTQFTGEIAADGNENGINEITGGTGKFAGITGRGPWKCKSAGENGELQCAQRLDYRLP